MMRNDTFAKNKKKYAQLKIDHMQLGRRFVSWFITFHLEFTHSVINDKGWEKKVVVLQFDIGVHNKRDRNMKKKSSIELW